MADPTITLFNLQKAIDEGLVICPNELDDGYKIFYDEPMVFGKKGKRYIVAKIINNEVLALSLFGLEDPLDGILCDSASYVVNKRHRGKGLAVESVNKGIEKLKSDFSKTGLDKFYIEAVIDRVNACGIIIILKLLVS